MNDVVNLRFFSYFAKQKSFKEKKTFPFSCFDIESHQENLFRIFKKMKNIETVFNDGKILKFIKSHFIGIRTIKK